MTRQRWPYIALWAGACALYLQSTGRAEESPAPEPETITVRGETMKVWPFTDLRERGFDIPDVSREDNAFWVYVDAINAFQELPEDLSDEFVYAITTAWPAGHDEKLKSFLFEMDNQKALALARKATQRPEHQLYYFGDPNGSVISVVLPGLTHYRYLAKLLVAEGRRCEAQGAYKLAMENYATALRMGHHVAGGITLIENLVGVAIWSLGNQAITQLVLRQDLSSQQLQEILDTLDELREMQPAATPGIRNERVFGNCVVDELTARPFHLLQSLDNLGNFGGEATPNWRHSNWHRLEARFGQLLLPDRTIKAHMNAYYDELIDRASKPAYAADWGNFDEEEAVNSIPSWNVIARIMLPSVSRASILSERCRMQARATRVSVALRLFAAENEGLPPRRLEELANWLPAEDLTDPFSGREFQYAQREGAWRFYSVSDNFTDDGGQVGENQYEKDYVVRFPPPAIEPFEREEEVASAP